MSHPAIESWRRRGRFVDHDGHQIFVVDEPARADERSEPLLVLHGFPSSSFDFRHVLDRLAEHRRVVIPDYLGYGWSDKPDRSYSLALQADVVETVLVATGLEQVALLTHNIGDSIGGELLRRALEGRLGLDVRRRVVTNGSIYMDLVQLTDGQQLLLSLPDEALPDDPEAFGASFRRGLAATFAPGHQPDADELDAQWALAEHEGGYRLLPRHIRYVDERRADEQRFTGAIEAHPSPLGVVWGDADPVARYPMAQRLHDRVPGSTLTTLTGVGHYPMIEAPDRFADAALAALETRTAS